MRCRLPSATCIIFTVSILFIFAFIQLKSVDNEESIDPESLVDPNAANEIVTDSKILILIYTNVFYKPYNADMGSCPLKKLCEVTLDKAAISKADAVVFHPPDMFEPAAFPERAFPEQKRVMMSMESPINVDLQKAPKNYFDVVQSFLSNSDVHMPYGGYWVNPERAKERGFQPVDLPSDEATIMKNKSIEGVFWLVSNCNTFSKREVAVAELAKHVRVDVAGKCAKEADMKSLCPPGDDCHEQVAKYYFVIIVENTVCRDYITEKYWYRYELPLIPIVMRKSVYELRVPPKSFIAMDEFPDAAAMGAHLKMLMQNRTAYMEYFEWRKHGWATAPWNTKDYRLGLCDLCDKLVTKAFKDKEPYDDVGRWYLEQGACERDEFVKSWVRTS